MKSVIIAIVIFALVIGCAFFITFHFQSFTEKMLHKLDSLPNNMENLEKNRRKRIARRRGRYCSVVGRRISAHGLSCWIFFGQSCRQRNQHNVYRRMYRES